MSKRVFDNIATGLGEATAIATGEADRSTYRVHLPAEVDVRAIRHRTGLTQQSFAAAFGFPVQTLRDWEQLRSRPDTSARAYLMVISREPEIVRRALQEAAVI